MKTILLFICIVGVWLLHGGMLLEVSKHELLVKETRKKLEEVSKKVEKKEMEYDAIIDLEKIEKEMKAKNKMNSSKEIKFFKIED